MGVPDVTMPQKLLLRFANFELASSSSCFGAVTGFAFLLEAPYEGLVGPVVPVFAVIFEGFCLLLGYWVDFFESDEGGVFLFLSSESVTVEDLCDL